MAVRILFPVLGAAGAAYLFCLAPGRDRRDRLKTFEERYIAHRGLFDNAGAAPENSLGAFRLAVEKGYGIELDVQLTADRRLVVFHDKTLKRMCGVNAALRKCSYQELQQYTLMASEERIPLLEEALKEIGGKVPLIVEIKSDGDWREVAEATAEIMDRYEGCYCVESFYPLVLGWFRKNRPEVIRGQLATDFFKSGTEKKWYRKVLASNLLLNFKSRPDFIAYNHLYAGQFSYRLCRQLFPVGNAAWTIKSQEELAQAEKTFQIIIFDSFVPLKH